MSLTSAWRQLSRGVRGLLRGAAADMDVSDEVQHFLDQAAASFVAQGLSPDAARRAARLEFGNVTTIREQVRGSVWENAVASLFTDARYAVRMVRRSPVFTVVVVLVISLGVAR